MLVSATAFGQGANASLSGTIADTTRGVLPGASVTALNTETGAETRTSANASGVYNFTSLPPGTYNVTAEAPGFQRMLMTDVRLRMATQNSLNFELAVAGTTTEVEVVATAENMIIEAGASTGSIIQEELVVQLPILTGSALDLVRYMGGVVMNPTTTVTDPLWTLGETTVAGVRAGDINITRDGVSVNEVRFDSGINVPNRINPELVGEFRMVISPVDAELGRGAGQVQVTTRSGSNAFRGSAVWNIQNTALDANEWVNKNRTNVIRPPWRNLNNYTVTFSGPIIPNRTFFFASWDHQIAITKQVVTSLTVLTPCARKGIYRYLDGVINSPVYGGTGDPITISSSPRALSGWGSDGRILSAYSLQRPVVNLDGSPLEVYQLRESNSYNRPVPTYPDNHPFFPGESYSYDAAGLPRLSNGSSPLPNYSGVELNNRLVYQSVLGPLSAADRQTLGGIANSQYANPGSPVYSNCDGYSVPSSGSYANNGSVIPNGTGWDVYRNGYDRTPFIAGFTEMMPLPNDYTSGDGLNTAGHRWTRRQDGNDSVYGTGDANRKAISFRIDHNINDEHRLSGTYSFERAVSDDTGISKSWPNGANSTIERTPQTFQVTLTSTIRPTLLNEVRVGLNRTASYTNNPLSSSKYSSQVLELIARLMPTDNWKYNHPVIPSPGSGVPGPYGHFWGSSVAASWGGRDPRWSVIENVTWIKGAHSFKGGLEFRHTQSWQDGEPTFGGVIDTPTISGGVMTSRSPYGTGAELLEVGMKGPLTGLYGDPWQGLSVFDSTGDYTERGEQQYGGTTKITNAYSLLTYLSGSVASINQNFFSTGDSRWNDPLTQPTRVVDLKSRELHLFFKDDWKVTRDLTLNLGVRWEYYGVPWEASGQSAGVKNQVRGLWGISSDLAKWMPDWSTVNVDKYKNLSDQDYAARGTEQIFIGPNSVNSDVAVYNGDFNNFAPHVGFAWQLPWLGRGKTTLRGGYSISYTSLGNANSARTNLAGQPGMSRDYSFTGNIPDQDGCGPGIVTGDCYINFANVGDFLPLNIDWTGQLPIGHPDRKVTPYNRLGGLTIWDPNIRNPYVQNVNMSVTRNLNNFLTLDVRYVATLSRKSSGTLNLNTTNYFNNGLFEEFRKLRAGGYDMKSLTDFPVLNSGIVPYKGDPNGSTTASLYAYSAGGVLFDDLSGAEQVLYQNFSSFATGAFQTIANSLVTANFHSTLRTAGLRPNTASGESSGQVLRAGKAPHNLIRLNPQYDGVNVVRNQGRSNYHSMQAQVTMRPYHGLNFSATWTWSRALSRGSVLDYREDSPYYWETEYGPSGQHRLHTLNIYGTYELPLGARGFFFRDASGVFKKAIEGWQLGWIGQLSSGQGMSLDGIATVWGTNRAVQVGEFDTKDTGMKWYPNGNERRTFAHGTYFNKEYGWIRDPQCDDPGVVNQTAAPIAGGTPMRTTCGNMGNLNGLVEVSYDKDGNRTEKLIFRNALPGEIGNVNATNMIYGPGTWSLDMSMSKSVEFMEGKRLEFRMDAQNIFNHASPSFGQDTSAQTYSTNVRVSPMANPNAQLNSFWAGIGDYPFGYTNIKAGHRTFQARLRLSF